MKLHTKRRDGADGAALGSAIDFGPANHEKAYRAHPDPSLDIAAINVSEIFAKVDGLYHRHLDRTIWMDFSDERLIPMREVMFVGYPLGLYDQKNNLPVARAGRIASHPRADFDGKLEYIVDAQVFPGSSGSPVFVALDGKYRFAGIVGRSHFQEQTLGTMDVALVQTYRQFVGLGVVYKPAAVTELLQSMAAEFRVSAT